MIIKVAPLYDHGLSLYADIQEFQLEQEDKETWEKIDGCKPFCNLHHKQLNLIGEVKLPKVPLKELFEIVDKYKEYLSDHRVECIKHLLETRYNHLVEREIRTRGMCMEDYFWLSKGEKYKEVHIRYLAEHNRMYETPIPFGVEQYPAE